MTVLIALVAGGGWFWLDRQFRAAGPSAQERVVIIPRGAGPQRIARDLRAAGVIADPRVFNWGLKLLADPKPLRAGEFAFPARVSAAAAVGILQGGRTVMRRVTVAEGLSTAEVAAVLSSSAGLSGELGSLPEEGWLLPETYHYAFGDERAEIVERMRGAMTSLLDELWASRVDGLPLKSPKEALVLASIVEKETGVASERRRVAAVFINRLRRGMRLQSDPTVIYGMTLGRRPLARPLSRKDLQTPTPYNTYVIRGLPPTAIANPGRAALQAVLNPADSQDLYFVADGTGGHAFARTLKEHNANVAKWRRIERQRRNGAN